MNVILETLPMQQPTRRIGMEVRSVKAVIMSIVLTATLLAGCGSSSAVSTTSEKDVATTQDDWGCGHFFGIKS